MAGGRWKGSRVEGNQTCVVNVNDEETVLLKNLKRHATSKQQNYNKKINACNKCSKWLPLEFGMMLVGQTDR